MRPLRATCTLVLALLAARADAAVSRGPYLQMGTPHAMTVRWRTSTPTDSRVWLGPAPGSLAPALTDTALTTEHEMRLTGLTAGTHYAYAVGTSSGILSGNDADTWFETPPEGTATTRAWVLGDAGQSGLAQQRVRDSYLAYAAGTRTDVWLMLGDNAYDFGNNAEYQACLFDPFAAFLRTHVLWPTRGEHDFLFAGANNDYYEIFTLPQAGEAGGVSSATEAWYSFDHGDVHFVCLDSEGSSRAVNGAMMQWLVADLAATTRRWIIAFWHHPPYTKGSHDSDDVQDSGGRMTDMRENAMPILENAGVDLVLGAHSHSYERSFLLDRHYGLSSQLTPAMIKDGGDGRPAGDGAYVKPAARTAHAGEVVVVAGSSSQSAGGALNHPAMAYSLPVRGSFVIDVRGDSLQARFLDELGAVRDSFAIVKPFGPVGVPPPTASLALSLAGPNPSRFGAAFTVTLPHESEARLSVVDAAGRLVRRLNVVGGRAEWDGRGTPAGVYFAVLEFEGARRVARVVLLP